METKICSLCDDPKPVDEFRLRTGRQDRDSYCNECKRLNSQENYRDNKQRYIDAASRNGAKYRDQIYTWLLEYFKNHPCLDCGETDPVVLEFDHRDGEQKVLSVSALVKRKSLKRVQEEVAKCDVRCGNCHKRRTAVQRHWYWLEFLKNNV